MYINDMLSCLGDMGDEVHTGPLTFVTKPNKNNKGFDKI